MQDNESVASTGPREVRLGSPAGGARSEPTAYRPRGGRNALPRTGTGLGRPGGYRRRGLAAPGPPRINRLVTPETLLVPARMAQLS